MTEIQISEDVRYMMGQGMVWVPEYAPFRPERPINYAMPVEYRESLLPKKEIKYLQQLYDHHDFKGELIMDQKVCPECRKLKLVNVNDTVCSYCKSSSYSE